ncbi:MAG: alpha/beta hydrolase, partial [Candidatus Alcyoniella australis]|nr:alpha/beta hydrolase [Candidatus Alcyoniella australis]
PTYEERFKSKRQPFMFIQGNLDSTVPLESIQAALDQYEGPKTLRIFGQSNEEPEFGHIDLLTGDEAPNHVWPAMLDWMTDVLDSSSSQG